MKRKISQARPRPNRTLMELRINNGLSANRLALRAGVSGNTVRAAERGAYICEDSQHAIAEALDARVIELFPFERQRVAA